MIQKRGGSIGRGSKHPDPSNILETEPIRSEPSRLHPSTPTM